MRMNVKVLVFAGWLLVANSVVGSDRIYNLLKSKTSKHKESTSALKIRAVNMYNLAENFYKVPSGIEEQVRGDLINMSSSNQNGQMIRIELVDKNVKPVKVYFSGMISETQYINLVQKLKAKS